VSYLSTHSPSLSYIGCMEGSCVYTKKTQSMHKTKQLLILFSLFFSSCVANARGTGRVYDSSHSYIGFESAYQVHSLCSEGNRSGSAVAISPHLLLSAKHVFENCEDPKVKVGKNGHWRDATILASLTSQRSVGVYTSTRVMRYT
jgi:hypothetical protein